MDHVRALVDWGVLGALGAASVVALAVAVERWRYMARIDAAGYASRVRLESDLTARLSWLSTIAANAPYLGLLGTVLGIMLTFEGLAAGDGLDARTIMSGLALALKATAAGIVVAIPCVVANNALRRRARERLVDFDEAHGR